MTISEYIFIDNQRLKVCRVPTDAFNVTLAQFRKGPTFNDTFKKIFLEDPFFYRQKTGIVFSDGEKGIQFTFSKGQPFNKIYNNPALIKDAKYAFEDANVTTVCFYRMTPDNQGTLLTSRRRFEDVEKILDIHTLYRSIQKEIDGESRADPRNGWTDEEKMVGRKKFPGEKEWFKIDVFKPTEKDDGKCVLFGYAIPPSEGNFLVLEDGIKVEGMTLPFSMFAHLTRKKFAVRVALRDIWAVKNILQTEIFFNRALPDKILPFLVDKTKNHGVEIVPYPRTDGKSMLVLLPNTPPTNMLSPRKIFLLADDPSNESFVRFVGQLTMQKTIGEPLTSKTFLKHLDGNVKKEKIGERGDHGYR